MSRFTCSKKPNTVVLALLAVLLLAAACAPSPGLIPQESALATDYVYPAAGEKIAIGLGRLIIADLSTGETWHVDSSCDYSDVSWAPNGRYLAVTISCGGIAGQYIDVYDRGSNQWSQLVVGPGKNANPDWSPDGSQIVFQSDRDGNYELYSVSVDLVGKAQGDPRRLTDHEEVDVYPTWSPDGRWILFSSSRASSFDLYLLNLETGETKVWQETPASDEYDSAWTSGAIAYSSQVGEGQRQVYTVAVDYSGKPLDSPVRRSVEGVVSYAPSWSPDGQVIFFYSDETPAGLFLVDFSQGGSKKYFGHGVHTDVWAP